MSKISSGRPALVRHVRLGVLALGIMLAWVPSGFAQMSPEEHASHHPGAAQPGSPSSVPPRGRRRVRPAAAWAAWAR